MSKPTIFFSHSSNDKKLLKIIKNEIINKTGSSVEIFLSSDGQSIPFGKNWVHEIEEALDETSLMFVFLSPNSITSNWVYFESGYSYSKDVQVIPVGINGIDLTNISPPLSLLQGFNLDKPRTLGNIIAIINKKYDTKFDTVFDNSKLFEVITSSENIIPAIVVKINLFIRHDEDVPDFFKPYFEKFEEMDIHCVVLPESSSIRFNGMTIDYDSSSKSINFEMDSLLIEKYLQIINDVFLDVITKFGIAGNLILHEGFMFDDSRNKISALLVDSDIKLDGYRDYTYKDVSFYLTAFIRQHDTPIYEIEINDSKTLVSSDTLKSLVNLLLDRNVIYQ